MSIAAVLLHRGPDTERFGATAGADRGPGGTTPISSAHPPESSDAVRAATGGRRLLVVALATAGGAGFAPVAPGTFGAAVGVGGYALLAGWGGGAVLGAAAAGLGAGIWAAGEAERVFGREDDGRIVIDEVVGQLLALAPLPWLVGPPDLRAPWLLATGFLAFRLFDIWKPGPVRRAERGLPGGLGVMLDDVLAGLLAAAVVAAAALAWGAPA